MTRKFPEEFPGFLVWNPAARVPTFIHRELTGAESEAKRLATLHPGQRFFIMSACGVAYKQPPDAEITWFREPDLEIPS